MEAFQSLFEEAAAVKRIAPLDELPIVSRILAKRRMQHLVIPELGILLDEIVVNPVTFERQFDQYRIKPWIMLHTSGSTGTPKVVILRHRYYATIDAYDRFGSEMVQRAGNMRVFNPFPPFCMASFMWSLPIIY